MNSSISFTISYFMLGILMSTVSTTLFDCIGIPTMPELFYFPFLYFRRNDFTFSKEWRNSATLSVIIWAAFVCFAVLNQRYSLGAIFTTARAYLYICIFAIWAYHISLTSKFNKAIFLTSCGSITGWVIIDFLQIAKILPIPYLGITYGNMVAIAICIPFSFILFTNIKSLVFTLLSNMTLSFTTSLRRQIFISALSVILSYIIIAKRRSSLRIHLLIIISLGLIIVNMPLIEKQVYDISPTIYHRVFNRTRSSFTGDNKGDIGRSNMFVFLNEKSGELQIPHGFVSKRTRTDEGTGLYIDYPLYELLYTFGLYITIPFLLFYVFKIMSHIVYAYNYKSIYTLMWIIPGIICFILFFIDSTFLTYTYSCPMTGFVFGIIARRIINYENQDDAIEIS